ncbi:MAG: hypothetical protein MJK14_18010 [Rivularia sp. ALOHA_DT_140]|nr:hypothetical protein [Rivularia sp. ALOHA_DT_140]
MLAQFQSLYPTGSLTTELLQIHHGKYIVRSSVSIENVIRSTGMAAAETIEEAEDRSRTRALMVLAKKADKPQAEPEHKEIKTSPKANLEVLPNRSLTSTFTAEKEHSTENVISPEVSQAPVSKTLSTDSPEVIQTPDLSTASSTDSPEINQTPDLSATSELFSVEENNDIYSQDFEKPLPIPTYDEPKFDVPQEDEDKDIVSDTQPEPEPEPEPTKAASSSSS